MPHILAALLLLAAAAAPAVAADDEKIDAATKKLMAAVGFFQREMYDLAAQEYDEFLNQYPDHAEAANARYGLAVCHYRLGSEHYPQAIKQLQQVVAEKDFKQRDEALAVLGHCLLAEKQYDAALAAFDDLLKNHAKSRHAEVAALNRAQALFLLNKPKDAKKACEEFLKDYPKSPRRPGAEYFLACSQQAMGDQAAAAETVQKLLKNSKDSAYAMDATLLWGQCLENQEKFAEAAEKYKAFLDIAFEERKDQGYYSLGLALYKAGQYDKAIEALDTVVSKYPKGHYAPPGRLQLGLAQLAAGKPADARKTLQFVAKDDPERAPRAQYWMAQCDMAESKYDDARGKLDGLLKDAGDNKEAILYDRAICAMETEKFEQAAKEFQEYRDQFPKGKQAADSVYRQAFCLHRLGKYADSQKLCDQVPADADAKVQAGANELAAENLFLLDKHDEAAKRFEQLVKAAQDAKDEAKALRYGFRLGQCAFLKGNYPKAVELLSPVADNPAAAKDKHLKEAIFFLGDAQFQAGRYAPAVESFTKYLAADPGRKDEAQFKLGLAQLRANQVPAAGKTLGEMASGKLDNAWAQRAAFAYGQMAYHQMKQADKATEVLKKVLSAKDVPADVLAPTVYLLASIDFDAGKYPQAADGFADMIKRFPRHELAADAALQQAICLKETNKAEDAVKLLDGFLKDYPKSARVDEAKHLKGTCLAKLGRNDEAADVFTALAEGKSSRGESVLYELAWAQRGRKDNNAAAEAYRKLMEQYPSGKLAAAARTELAELLYLDKKYEEAIELLEKVIADKGVDAKTLSVAQYRLGWCYAEMSKPQQAAEIFGKFVESYPKDALAASAMYQVGVAQVKNGDNAAAEKTFANLLEKFPKDDVAAVAHLKLGEVQALNGDFEKSAATYQAFLKSYPQNEFAYMARFGLGWAMENQKKYDDARKWYQQVTENHNGPTAARAQFQIGECYFAEGNFPRAARELLNVDIVYAYPEWSASALYEAGRAFEQAGKPDDARKQYEQCAKKYGKLDSGKLAAKRLKEMEKATP